MRDKIFSNNTDLVDFIFDKKVADVFDDMVNRSVPGYQTMLEMIGLIVKIYAKDNSNFYDLGASTGATSLALGLHNTHQNNKIIAVDNAIEMARKCKKNLTSKLSNFEVVCSDINDIKFENASIVVLNLTMQFIDLKKRQSLVDNIFKGLIDGGVLVISEKIHFDDDKKQKQISKLHLNFKRANGYSELEISQKRQLIENVLVTDSKETHLNRLKIAGFSESICHFQCLNFASFLAVK
ncbi:MAG TPA: carboxy-S-adenosyl-L-methionine synthase CmoA [Gammaproteobacteria bacterium]|jgi:tRNA (cmo5U34)-methyltransferase|nr:carboxy-S-adenosyl-L-methionine synthase CmoA [Gammaproteobacteria bacterium]HAY41878.1 carboxy-S-adenosyl-L-methionine synthase CmoA [Gammaproteobacteria bacterium]|tara:strand:- start:2942 stop:3655 length:714 start_codon:yes stop_codon:yes gene_type:complete